MRWSHAVSLFLLVLLGACSLRSAMEALTTPEDRAFAQAMVDNLRRGNAAWLEQNLEPGLWRQSGEELADVPSRFPREPGTTEIVSFSVSRSTVNGRTERNKAFSLVTHGGGRWTVTEFRTFSSGGPDRVVQWSVVPHNAPPPELRMLESWEAALPWFWAGLIGTVLAVIALVVWLVRRSRRRRDPLAGQRSGTP